MRVEVSAFPGPVSRGKVGYNYREIGLIPRDLFNRTPGPFPSPRSRSGQLTQRINAIDWQLGGGFGGRGFRK
jgi:hypothetical protein